MADRFYTPQPLGAGDVTLDGDEAHHLAAVRRFAPGDAVTLFNGDGGEYAAVVAEVGKKRVVLNVSAAVPVSREAGFPLVVGAALPKGDRLDFLLEKLTELGATRFVPLATARSVVAPKDAKLDKWRRAVVEASKQCGRNELMAIDPPARLGDYLRRADLPAAKWLLHTTAEGVPSAAFRGGAAFAVGPEGGFTPDEVAEATAAGWRPLQFGKTVLRVETAAVAAAAWAVTLGCRS